jgi:hypothetical protein
MVKLYTIGWMLVVICIQLFGEQLSIYNQNNLENSRKMYKLINQPIRKIIHFQANFIHY